MKSFKSRKVFDCTAVQCDRCGHSSNAEGETISNFTCIDFDATWGSAFGDGNHVEVDFCHQCVKDLLGDWVRVTPSRWISGSEKRARGSSKSPQDISQPTKPTLHSRS